MHHDADEKQVIGLFREAGGQLDLSPPPYWEAVLSTRRLKDAFSRLLRSGVIERGQSLGGHGQRACVRYHLRMPDDESESDPELDRESSTPTELPEDIACRIVETFGDPQIQEQVTESLEKLGQTNVGADQLRRAILFLADGDYEQFKELRRTLMGDPRDLLCAANGRLVNKDYWFSTPFADMGPIKE